MKHSVTIEKKLTRQQRRKNQREFNKKLVKEGTSLLGRRLMDKEAKAEMEQYKPSSEHPAIMPFCIVFREKTHVTDYVQSCRAGAETFLDNDQPKIIILIREPHDIELPAPKKELMKIGTRIFRKYAPDRTYIFIEAEGTEQEHLLKQIGNFLRRLPEIPDDGPQPEWLWEYVHREEPPYYEEI